MNFFRVKRFGCMACVLLAFLLCLSACQNQPPAPVPEPSGEETPTSAPTGTDDIKPPGLPAAAVSYSIVENKDSLKINGRYSVLPDGITCDHTASGIEFSLYCEGDVTLTLSSEGESYFTVWIDGVKKRARLNVEPGESTVTVAKYLEEGVHTIRIAKQTESRLSRTVLKKLDFRGTFSTAPTAKPLYIEFIGDSITSGSGNLFSENLTNTNAALLQDGTQTYAFLAAEALNADCSVMSCSSIGVAEGYVAFNMSDFYAKNSYYRSKTEPFTVGRVPDAVVINLGTNDFSKQVDAEKFSTEVEKLILQVRTLYGNEVPIVWAYNMMNSGYGSLIRTVLLEMGGADAKLFSIPLTRETSGENGHPSISGHTQSAEILADYLNQGLSNGVWQEQAPAELGLDAQATGSGMTSPWTDGNPKSKK